MNKILFLSSILSASFSNILKYRLTGFSFITNKYTNIQIFKTTFPIFRPSNDGPTITCFEKDNVLVDTEEIFEDHCEDILGNKYEEYSETSSCCECLV